MAGFHQIWALDLESEEVRPYAGNGRERIEDGPLAEVELAQPSGIVAVDNVSYFTDSETSANLSADFTNAGVVTSIVGQDLFTFGDVDGSADEVRLQYPLGIDLHNGILYITDTYNNKIKRIYPHTREAASLLGSGRPCSVDGVGSEAEFREPGGIGGCRTHLRRRHQQPRHPGCGSGHSGGFDSGDQRTEMMELNRRDACLID